jgi:hypothetical protein
MATLAACEIGRVMVYGTTEQILQESIPFLGAEHNATVHAFDCGIAQVIRRRVDQHDFIISPAPRAGERYRL